MARQLAEVAAHIGVSLVNRVGPVRWIACDLAGGKVPGLGWKPLFIVSSPCVGDAHSGVRGMESSMTRVKILAAMIAAVVAGAVAIWAPWSVGAQEKAAGAAGRSGYEPVLNPANFVRVISNPYFPLPVGRTLVYRGIKDGKSQVDRVHVTSRTRVIEGITAVTVTDVATHDGKLLEKTSDWYAQDRQGNVWYLGEDTAEYLPGGRIDRSGSWRAGVGDAEPGIVMKANPRVPNAYRQEYLPGQAEDTAWIIDRGGSVTVPFGKLHHVLSSLEFSRLEPDVIDQKSYAPGIGIVLEQAVSGPKEVAKLVSVHG
jgi:hypothetical protein